MRKGIILGIGILIILLALAGTVSAYPSEYNGGCTPICHSSGFNGTFYNNTHKFNGTSVPTEDAPNNNCAECHSNPPSDMSMILIGQNYSIRHNGMNTSGYIMSGVNCSYCHTDPAGLGDFSLLEAGTKYNNTHKFDGLTIPGNATNCVTCHTDLNVFMPLVSKGPFYNATHRYNNTILASESLPSGGCYNCHVDNGTNFSYLISDPATYLTSSVCEDCHKKKYDDWYGTMHRVMLTTNTSGAVMNLTLPEGQNWSSNNVSYMVVGKTQIRYLNENGTFFQRYYVENQTFAPYSGNYSCGSCHTTGYNATGGNQSGLIGIVGTWEEEGITCENCHGPGGNGHQVTIYKKGEDCIKCHSGSKRQGPAMTNNHALGPAEEATNPSCTQCHSPYNRYTGVPESLGTATNITCSVCHNPHATTDDKYAGLLSPNGFDNVSYSVVEDTKLSFFNGTASNVSKFSNTSVFTGTNASLVDGNDVYDDLSLVTILYPFLGSTSKIYNTQVIDDSYGDAGIDLTGRPQSEILCSMCHYRHGLEHIPGLNLSHGRNNVTDSNETATCIDCHMSKAGSKTDHSFDAQEATNYPQYTCSKGTNCHVTSSENVALSNISIVPIENEWAASAHNDKEVGVGGDGYNHFYGNISAGSPSSQELSCNKCHSPMDWNPAKESDTTKIQLTEEFKGITCGVCHNIHDMGNSINASGLKYSWYNRDATKSGSRYKANYTLMEDTIELCGNCHSNDDPRRYRAGPGWNGTDATKGTANPIRPHGFPAKDIFVGSFKESGMNFECIDCHMYVNKTNATGGMANDTEKITGHSFKVNETGLQSTSRCGGCHDGTNYATIPDKIEEIQVATEAKWNSTNATVMGALATYNSYTGVKTLSADKIARAYWNLRMVDSDESWGVHDPVGTSKLLEDALTYAEASNTSLGQGLVSTVDLKAGWNNVALKGQPATNTTVSVMSSAASNITIVWGYNTSKPTKWEFYDPTISSSLNSLKTMDLGQGYWIYAKQDCKWTV